MAKSSEKIQIWFFIWLLTIVPLALPFTVFAQTIDIGGDGFNALPSPGGKDAAEMTRSLVYKIIDNVRYIIGAVALIMFILAAIRLIIARGEEEEYNKQKSNLLYAIVGLAVVALAGDVSEIFEVSKSSFLQDQSEALQRVKIFNRTVEVVITFVKYIIGSVAVLFIVRSGLRMVIQGVEEEEMAKDKKALYWAVLGFVFIIIADPLVNKVFFKLDDKAFPGSQAVRPELGAQEAISQIVGLTNLMVAFAVPLATISLVAGGLMYALARGEEEKLESAKKVMLWSVLGLVLIYGAFAIVSTFIAGKFEGI